MALPVTNVVSVIRQFCYIWWPAQKWLPWCPYTLLSMNLISCVSRSGAIIKLRGPESQHISSNFHHPWQPWWPCWGWAVLCSGHPKYCRTHQLLWEAERVRPFPTRGASCCWGWNSNFLGQVRQLFSSICACYISTSLMAEATFHFNRFWRPILHWKLRDKSICLLNEGMIHKCLLGVASIPHDWASSSPDCA